MKTTAQVIEEIRSRLEKRWYYAVAGVERGDWPFKVALGTPLKVTLEADFRSAHEWVHTWKEWAAAHGLTLDWRTRLVRGTRQPLPTHLTVPDIDAAARICGQGWLRRLTEARRRIALLMTSFPHVDHTGTVRAAEALSDVDFDLLLDAARWFTTNTATGLTPRQVPLPGFHGKWLNRNQALICTLSGQDDLGLIDRPTRVHFTYLDPDHLAGGGRKHESVTIGDLIEPVYEPETIVILENKDTAVYFPAVRKGIAVEGEGTKAPGALPRISWISGCPRVVYWGDIDAAGLTIVNSLRLAGIDVDTMLMNFATYEAYEQYGAWTDDKGKPVPCSPRRNLAALTPDERRLYEALTDPTWARVRRVEQERMPLHVAVAHLDALIALLPVKP